MHCSIYFELSRPSLIVTRALIAWHDYRYRDTTIVEQVATLRAHLVARSSSNIQTVIKRQAARQTDFAVVLRGKLGSGELPI